MITRRRAGRSHLKLGRFLRNDSETRGGFWVRIYVTSIA